MGAVAGGGLARARPLADLSSADALVGAHDASTLVATAFNVGISFDRAMPGGYPPRGLKHRPVVSSIYVSRGLKHRLADLAMAHTQRRRNGGAMATRAAAAAPQCPQERRQAARPPYSTPPRIAWRLRWEARQHRGAGKGGPPPLLPAMTMPGSSADALVGAHDASTLVATAFNVGMISLLL